MDTETVQIVETAVVVVTILSIIFITLRKYWVKMNENEKLKNEFITIVAHKFRTPLTHIKWISDELAQSETNSFKKEKLLDIQHSNKLLVDLLGTLIELAGSDDASTQIYDSKIYPLFESVKNMVDSLKEDFHMKNLFISISCESEDVLVNVDKNQLEFVIQSLLENALIYSSPGKNVDVAVGKVKNKAVFVVKDNGIGIENADQSHIFTKFFRAKNASRMDTEGFGVSLYLTRSILKRLGGRIDVYSAGAGTGTTCTVTLPLAKGK